MNFQVGELSEIESKCVSHYTAIKRLAPFVHAETPVAQPLTSKRMLF